MSNLGPYQEITTRAAQLGGVDQLISDIGAEAVAKAAPQLTGKGVVMGIALSAGAVVAAMIVKERHAVLEAGRAARARLTSALTARYAESDSTDVASPKSPSPSSEEERSPEGTNTAEG